MITTSGHLVTDLATLKKVVYRDANAFATKENKVMVPVSTKEVARSFTENPAFELQFRLANPNDSAASRAHLSTQAKGSDSAAENAVGQLERLNNLREEGALTEAEFQQAKRKILGAAGSN